jgi:hypothetical protein
MRAGLAPPAPRRRWRRRTASRPIVGEGNGSRTPSAATETDPRAGERRVGASASFRSKLDFRLEHELQPWWDGLAPPRGITRLLLLSARSGSADRRRRRAKIPVASSLRDRLCRARRIPRRVIMSAGTVANGVGHPLWLGSIATDAPHALTGTEPEPVSTPFLRPPAGNWQVAPRICPAICADRSLREQRDESPQPHI